MHKYSRTKRKRCVGYYNQNLRWDPALVIYLEREIFFCTLNKLIEKFRDIEDKASCSIDTIVGNHHFFVNNPSETAEKISNFIGT